ncbi:hypothetical protein PYCC9005_000796 [Savitreella phatthalungensis]
MLGRELYRLVRALQVANWAKVVRDDIARRYLASRLRGSSTSFNLGCYCALPSEAETPAASLEDVLQPCNSRLNAHTVSRLKDLQHELPTQSPNARRRTTVARAPPRPSSRLANLAPAELQLALGLAKRAVYAIDHDVFSHRHLKGELCVSIPKCESSERCKTRCNAPNLRWEKALSGTCVCTIAIPVVQAAKELASADLRARGFHLVACQASGSPASLRIRPNLHEFHHEEEDAQIEIRISPCGLHRPAVGSNACTLRRPSAADLERSTTSTDAAAGEEVIRVHPPLLGRSGDRPGDKAILTLRSRQLGRRRRMEREFQARLADRTTGLVAASPASQAPPGSDNAMLTLQWHLSLPAV